ncbi:MAG: AAA family ATPase [Zoogloeaceae bacterium]|nr:AAA family ATPase [Zoogloeaceae bacterium]
MTIPSAAAEQKLAFIAAKTGVLDPVKWPEPLDLEALSEREPEPLKFIVPDWLPCGYATLLAGHGGVGKSGIALTLAVCIAAGVPFFGLHVERRRVLYLSCEDREQVLHWRLTRICRYLGIDMARLRGWLEIIDLVGVDSVLWEQSAAGATYTPGFAALQERIAASETQVLFVDGISDSFAGNENSRPEVKRYVNALTSLIPADTGAALLVGHVSKPSSTAGANGDGYSGSTGWHNSVRARWYLYPETADNDDGERNEKTGALLLDLQKSNLGRDDQTIRFRWDADAHLFVGEEVAGMTEFDRRHRDRAEQRGILAALAGCTRMTPPITVPTATTGQRTAFHVLSQRPEFPASLRTGAAGKRRFWKQIEALRQMHAIVEAGYRRACGHKGVQISLTTEGERRIGEYE